MPITYLTRRVRFGAAHRYHRPEWSEEQDRAAFGACSNPHGHGHSYQLEVMLAAAVDEQTGFSADLALVDRVLREHVTEPLDHQHLDYAVPRFAPGAKIPTSENLLIFLWEQLEDRFDGARLVRLRLREEEDLFVDYYGPDPAERPFRGRVFEV